MTPVTISGMPMLLNIFVSNIAARSHDDSRNR